MAFQYQVQAQVVDLRMDTPRSTDRFFIDSNVWFWATYSNIYYAQSGPDQLRVSVYPPYLQKAVGVKAELLWCGLSLSELAHQIEKTEFEIYKQWNAPTQPFTIKDYRHGISGERQRVVQEIQSAWQAVVGMGRSLPGGVSIDTVATTAALRTLSTIALDGHDVFCVQAMKMSGLTQALSDDGDYCLVPGITLYTANRNVVNAARAQGKLVTR